MSFPWSYSILGLVPGLILTVVVAMLVLYTSLITWEFCLRHPEVRDVCDVGEMIFWNKRWAWWFTTVMFLLNNTVSRFTHTPRVIAIVDKISFFCSSSKDYTYSSARNTSTP